VQTVNYDIVQNLLADANKIPVVPGTSVVPGTYVSADQQNLGRRGLKLTVDITANAGAFTFTVTIQGKDPLSGKYYTLLQSAALAANGTTILTVYPGVTPAANVAVSDVLPSTWRVSVTLATSNATATIGGSEIV
jgi:hypothetical protein